MLQVVVILLYNSVAVSLKYFSQSPFHYNYHFCLECRHRLETPLAINDVYLLQYDIITTELSQSPQHVIFASSHIVFRSRLQS